MVGISQWTLVVFCASLLAVAHATLSPDKVGPQPGCPSPLGLVNGGFESGKIAPWSLDSNSNPTDKQHIVSPGFNGSKHALQVDFVSANITEYDISQTTTGMECFGYYYNISYAWNWVKYSGPEGPGSGPDGDYDYCAFSVYTGYTGGAPRHYGTRTPGWHHHSYVTRDIYSHCKPAFSAFLADVTCVGPNGGNGYLPPFSIQFDALHIQTAPGNPNPPPSCAP